MKCPEKHVKDDFLMWWHLHIYLKCPKIQEFHFRFLRCFTIDHVGIIQKTPLFYVRNIRNAFFPFHDQIKKEKWDISNISNIEKWGILNYSHVIKTENEPKMKLFDFGAFQINMKMPSHDKIIFHILFWGISYYFPYRNVIGSISPSRDAVLLVPLLLNSFF